MNVCCVYIVKQNKKKNIDSHLYIVDFNPKYSAKSIHNLYPVQDKRKETKK